MSLPPTVVVVVGAVVVVVDLDRERDRLMKNWFNMAFVTKDE